MIHLSTHSGAPRATTVTPAQPTKPAESTKPAGPTHEEIERRAYDLYLKRGCKDGQCEDDWRKAEQAMRNEGGASIPATACCDDKPGVDSLVTALPTIIPSKDSPRLSTVPESPGVQDPKPRR